MSDATTQTTCKRTATELISSHHDSRRAGIFSSQSTSKMEWDTCSRPDTSGGLIRDVCLERDVMIINGLIVFIKTLLWTDSPLSRTYDDQDYPCLQASHRFETSSTHCWAAEPEKGVDDGFTVLYLYQHTCNIKRKSVILHFIFTILKLHLQCCNITSRRSHSSETAPELKPACIKNFIVGIHLTDNRTI